MDFYKQKKMYISSVKRVMALIECYLNYIRRSLLLHKDLEYLPYTYNILNVFQEALA